jgi:hypothetical protein
MQLGPFGCAGGCCNKVGICRGALKLPWLDRPVGFKQSPKKLSKSSEIGFSEARFGAKCTVSVMFEMDFSEGRFEAQCTASVDPL